MSLEAVAIHNVVEGCVRESFGAMVAEHQAACAVDADVRALMHDIAGDELRHAALSWTVDAWATAHLGEGFRHRRRAAALDAINALLVAIAMTPEPACLADAGLPGQAASHILWAGAWERLWAPNFESVGAAEPGA